MCGLDSVPDFSVHVFCNSAVGQYSWSFICYCLVPRSLGYKSGKEDLTKSDHQHVLLAFQLQSNYMKS